MEGQQKKFNLKIEKKEKIFAENMQLNKLGKFKQNKQKKKHRTHPLTHTERVRRKNHNFLNKKHSLLGFSNSRGLSFIFCSTAIIFHILLVCLSLVYFVLYCQKKKDLCFFFYRLQSIYEIIDTRITMSSSSKKKCF